MCVKVTEKLCVNESMLSLSPKSFWEDRTPVHFLPCDGFLVSNKLVRMFIRLDMALDYVYVCSLQSVSGQLWRISWNTREKQVERVNSLAALMKGTVLFFQCYCAGMLLWNGESHHRTPWAVCRSWPRLACIYLKYSYMIHSIWFLLYRVLVHQRN